MSKKALLSILIFIPLVIISSGCKPACTPAEYEGFKVWPNNPSDGTIVNSLTPTFEWHSNEDCQPVHINLEVKKNELGPGTVYTTGGSATSYALTTPLDPASKYIWRPFASSTDGEYGKIHKWYWAFFTGPLCSTGVPDAPILDVPANGGYAEPLSANSGFHFQWHYPGDCLPTSYLYEFASDPNFQDIVLSGETFDYKSYLKWQQFPDCSTLYWRVAAKIGSQVGPWSDPGIFYYVYDGHCWQNHYLSDDFAQISGRVYRDMCDQTGVFVPSNFQLHAGCIKTINNIGRGDGNHASSEHGLLNVVVDLGAGPCPSTGLDQATTYGENGGFDFVVMTPGDYCLSVSRNQTGHDYTANVTFDLLKGMWTEPGSFSFYSLVAQKTISLEPGYHVVKQDFGWDEFDGAVKLFIDPTYCRIGPIPHCDPLRIYEFGEYAPMMARSADGRYVRTQFDGQVCYFRNFDQEPGDFPDGIAGIPEDVYEEMVTKSEVYTDPPPCPSPTPTPRPKPKPSGGDSCSQYSSERNCIAAGCTWNFSAAGLGYCSE